MVSANVEAALKAVLHPISKQCYIQSQSDGSARYHFEDGHESQLADLSTGDDLEHVRTFTRDGSAASDGGECTRYTAA
ncbi:unnamed protein product [Zymoseptoria tritici ST99CH_3D1]|nr:unnamed protein product [Zymoseptoria tritici ST99CH_3D1]